MKPTSRLSDTNKSENKILKILGMKHYAIVFISFVLGSQSVIAADWPVLKKYDQEHTYKIAMPVGGIGTGSVSLGSRGNLRDWEIMNKPAKYNEI